MEIKTLLFMNVDALLIIPKAWLSSLQPYLYDYQIKDWNQRLLLGQIQKNSCQCTPVSFHNSLRS